MQVLAVALKHLPCNLKWRDWASRYERRDNVREKLMKTHQAATKIHSLLPPPLLPICIHWSSNSIDAVAGGRRAYCKQQIAAHIVWGNKNLALKMKADDEPLGVDDS